MRTLEEMKAAGITKRTFIHHLDEMTEDEIALMLDLSEGKKYMESVRKACPEETARTYAEFERDF